MLAQISDMASFREHVAIVPQHWFNTVSLQVCLTRLKVPKLILIRKDGFTFFDMGLVKNLAHLGFQPGDDAFYG